MSNAEQHHDLEEYAGGEIQVRPGIVNRWLLVVYTILFLWALYYLFHYWGGLGPGLWTQVPEQVPTWQAKP